MAGMVTLAFTVLAAAGARAHEVQPTIGDMELIEGQLVFRLEGNFENVVAGINLDGLDDTENAPEADVYDGLRALEPDAFRAEFESYWPTMADTIVVLIDGEPAALELIGIEVPEIGDVEVVRQSVVTFGAATTDESQTMQIDWPAEYGVLVLRQMGVADGWDGYLSGGGLTDPVALRSEDASGWSAFFGFFWGDG